VKSPLLSVERRQEKEILMKWTASAFIALILTSASAYGIDTVSIKLDQRDGTLTCGGSARSGSCIAASGSLVTIDVINSVPDLLDLTVTPTAVHAAENKNIVSALFSGGLTPKSAGAAPAVSKVAAPPSANLDAACQRVLRDLNGINDVIYRSAMSGYPALKDDLTTAIGEVNRFASAMQKAVPDALKGQSGLPSDIASWWSNILALDAKSNSLASFPEQAFELEDDTKITIVFQSKNPLITPTPAMQAIVRVSDWRVVTTTGFAGSGLVDEHYTVRTIVDQAASGSTPAVTHREAIRETPDIANAEATYFVHLSNLSDLARYLPLSPTFGVGLGTGVSGRLYAGTSWQFGNRGNLTVGVALGQVKRLSHNIDPKHLDDGVDPEATRRTLTRAAPFVALSWRLGQ
jgi:hypothetical protein